MKDFTFVVVGDIGCRPGGYDRFRQFMPIIASHNPSLMLIVGDMMQGGTPGHYTELMALLKDINRKYALPIETTPGNHDTVDGALPLDYESQLGVKNGSFTFEGVRFVSVDSSSGTISLKSLESMRRNLSMPAFLMTHMPPAVGTWAFRGMKSGSQEFLEVLKDCSSTIMAAFFGHIHAYSSHTLVGVPSFTVGCSGAESFQLTKHGYTRPSQQGALLVHMRQGRPSFEPIYSVA